MFPSFRDSGPFLNLLPFPTGGGSAPTVVPGTPTVVGTQITFPSTSSGSLVGAVYGVEFGIGVGAGYVWSENVAGAASSQTITIDIATYGGTTSSTVNARIYYNLDVLDDPATRVYSAMLSPIVVSASLSGTTTEGQTLTGANGIIVGGYPMTLTQQWRSCDSGGANCSNITSATNTTYVLTSGEVGDTIRYVKTATNTAGSGSATSNASAVVTGGAVEVKGTPARQNATSFSYTVDAAATYLVVIAQWVDVGTVTVSAMTYNGVAMTRLSSAAVQSNSSGLYLGCDFWYLSNPATGANTLSATFSGNSFTPSLGAIGLSGVGSFGTPSTNSAGNPPGSATITAGGVTTSANGLLIGAVSVSQNGDNTYTVGGSGTNHWNAADGISLGRVVGATVPGTGGSVNFTEVQGGASPWNQGWVATSVPVNP